MIQGCRWLQGQGTRSEHKEARGRKSPKNWINLISKKLKANLFSVATEDKMTLVLKAKLWSFANVDDAFRRIQVLLSLKAVQYIEGDEGEEDYNLQDVLDDVHRVDDVRALETHAHLVSSSLSGYCFRVGL